MVRIQVRICLMPGWPPRFRPVGGARRRGPNLGRQGRVGQLHRPWYTAPPPRVQAAASRGPERLRLMFYGPNSPAYFSRAAYYVDRILRGAKPADLPVEQPMTFEFVVNMKTARELGITFPDEIMLQVTEVIQ